MKPVLPSGRSCARRVIAPFTLAALVCLAAVGMAVFATQAVEPWADGQLPVKGGLELWLDASRQNAARKVRQLPVLLNDGHADFWFDGSGKARHLAQRLPDARPRFRQIASSACFRFDGKDDFLAAANLGAAFTNATVFLVAAPRSNAGMFRAFLALNQAGKNDYTTGLNLDLGPGSSPGFSFANAEGAGFQGARNLLKSAFPFGTFHTLSLVSAPGKNGVRLFVDGQPEEQRDRNGTVLRMDEFTVGARCYSNTPEPPHSQGFLDGDIAEVLVFSRALSDVERQQVEKYLADKHAPLRAAGDDPAGPRLVETVANPPPIQMLVPGFIVRELPLQLPNVNNVKYRADGKLVALGYNGRIWLLSDTDGDGFEDKSEPFWDRDTLRSPIGLALTPPGYARGQGVFVPSKGKLSLIVDKDGDDRADEEIVVASGWQELPHGVDALGVALDAQGNIYFGLGTANFTDAYLVDKATGQARYDLKSERGTVLKVSPDFSKREIVCTGIRFPVGMAFNRYGDLFCTDQEGATWLPNGNPFDELLHIQPGRHYGFPPQHPKHLPGVIDEPSVFDYAPQHQSTCGLCFNEWPPQRAAGVPPAVQTSSSSSRQAESQNFRQDAGSTFFGPSWWAGDAFVAGESRGKIYRTKLVKTAAGYVAQNHLIACVNALTVDLCVSPRGDLMVATHSGKPDWGTGPQGIGKLYRVRYTDTNAPQPVLTWSASPTEIRIAFDRPLDPANLKNLAKETKITQGRYVMPGDRFESIRPGYQVVQDQMATPRYGVPVLSASVTPDHRTIVLTTPPRTAAVNYAIELPNVSRSAEHPLGDAADVAKDSRRAGARRSSHDQIDLVTDLNGVTAEWKSADGKETWQGWLPHIDLTAAKELTKGSAEHERLFGNSGLESRLQAAGRENRLKAGLQTPRGAAQAPFPTGSEQLWVFFKKPGTLNLKGQLNLWQMLLPAVQPGATVGWQYPPETVSLAFESSTPFRVQTPNATAASTGSPSSHSKSTLQYQSVQNQWLPFEIRLSTGNQEPTLALTWHTAEDNRPRALPLRRFFLPWATPSAKPIKLAAERQIPELAGGNWLRGRRVFFSEQAACFKCHQVGGAVGKLGPDLSNLVHRDYASVLKDIREPSAAINPDHIAANVELTDGESLTGVLLANAGDKLTLGDATGQSIMVPKAKVKSVKPATLSLMPEDLDKALGETAMKDLLTFLLLPGLEPAPLEREGAPPPRKRAEVEAVLGVPASAGPPKPPKGGTPNAMRVVLCDGPKDHGPGEHDYPLWQKRWSKLLALADGVTIDTAHVWPGAEQFAKADVIVFFSANPGWNAARSKELDAFLARGGGTVFLHYAVNGQKDVEALCQRIGLAWRGGTSKFRHGPLDLKLHDHPLARGFGKLDFIDESYWNLVGDPKDIQVLASGVEEGVAQPLIWTRQQGKGRAFVSIPGHYTWTFDDPLFRVLILRGICWSAGQPMDRLAELAAIGARMAE